MIGRRVLKKLCEEERDSAGKKEGTHYIKFKLKNDLPANLVFEYGEAIPWLKLPGNADQVKSSIKFNDLHPSQYEILEMLKFDGTKWIKLNK